MNRQLLFLLFWIASISFFQTACSEGSQGNADRENTVTIETPPAPPPAPAEEESEPEGLSLMKGSDCFTCHQTDVTVVGPSFKAIEEKYPLTEANVANLKGKIIKGSVGVWGQVAMPGHPNLSEVEAEKMARYLLSL